MSPRRKTLYALTVATIATLAVVPTTRWLVRAQFGGALLQSNGLLRSVMSGKQSASEDHRVDAVIAAHPDDFTLQYARAISAGDTEERIARLRELREHFPDRAEIDAALLRNWSMGAVKVGHRAEIDSLSPRRDRASKDMPEDHSNPAVVAEFDTIAAEGERLEPDNAFFPLMRSVGLLAANRDDEATAAFLRAGEAPHFRDYAAAEVPARIRLAQQVSGGEIGGIERTAIWATVLLPHYARMRGAARIVVAKAVEAEQAGRTDEGLALRTAAMQVGTRMRTDSNVLIGSLVGISCTRTAGLRPGGAEPLKPRVGNDAEEINGRAVDTAYTSYLDKIGHHDIALAYTDEVAKGHEVRSLINESNDKIGLIAPDIDRLMPLWGIAFALLGNVAALLGIAGLLTIGRRLSPSLRNGQPLIPAERWGATFGLLTPGALTALSAAALAPTNEYAPAFWLGGLAYLGLLIGIPLARRWERSAALRGVAMMAAIIVGQVVLIGYLMSAFRETIGAMMSLISCTSGAGAGNEVNAVLGAAAAAALISGIVPGLFAIGLLILARPLKIPASHAIARGFEALAGPLACVVMLAYAGLAITTVRQEAKARQTLDAMLQNEIAWRAQLLGKN